MTSIARFRLVQAAAAAALACVFLAPSIAAVPQAYPGPAAQQSTNKILKFKGIVVTANIAAIIVRDPKNQRRQVGFSYSPPVRDKMLKIVNAGGFRYGDKVTVEYSSGTLVALKIHGKPSKPKKQQPPPQQTQ